MAKIAVLGAGGWGTALAVMADRYGNAVTLWTKFEEEAAMIRQHGEHKKLLPGIPVPPSVDLTTDLRCAAEADLVLMAAPSFAIAETAAKALASIPASQALWWPNCGKGAGGTAATGIFPRCIAGADSRRPGGGAVRPFPCGGGGQRRAHICCQCFGGYRGGGSRSGNFDESLLPHLCQRRYCGSGAGRCPEKRHCAGGGYL